MIKERILQRLNYELSEFIEDINIEQIDFGLLQGNVYLENLRLKRGALRRFGVPVDVYRGVIKRLSLRVSLLHWFTEPMQVEVDGVYAIVLPGHAMPYDPVYEERVSQHEKNIRLRDLERELAEEDGTLNPESKQKASIFNLKLLAKTINNLQLTINHLHLRFEDWSSNLAEGFSLGLTLSRFSLISTDAGWTPVSSKEPGESGFFKRGLFSFLGVYLAPEGESPFLRDRPQPEFEAQLERLILEGELSSSHLSYLLRPIQAELRLSFSTDMEHITLGEPKLSLCLLLDFLEITLSQAQFHDLLLLFVSLLEPSIASQARMLRPPPGTLPITPHGARLYWLYAIGCVLKSIKDRKKTWTWDFLQQRRDVRRRYIQIYQALQSCQESERAELQQSLRVLEAPLSLEDIRFYRKLARARLSPEQKRQVQAPKATGVQELLLEIQRRMATLEVEWLEWQLSSPGGSTFLTKSTKETFPTHLSEEEIWEIYSSVGYTPSDQQHLSQWPADFSWLDVSVQIPTGVLAFFASFSEEPLARIDAEDLEVSLKKQKENSAVDIKLGFLSVHGGTNLLMAPMMMYDCPRPYLHATVSSAAPHRVSQKVSFHLQPTQYILEADSFKKIASFFKLPENSTLKKRISRFATFTLKNLLEEGGDLILKKLIHSPVSELQVVFEAQRFTLPSKALSALFVHLGTIELHSKEADINSQQDYGLVFHALHVLLGPEKDCIRAIQEGDGPTSLHLLHHRGPSELQISKHLEGSLFFVGGTFSTLMLQLSPETSQSALAILELAQAELISKNDWELKPPASLRADAASRFWIPTGHWVPPSDAIKLSASGLSGKQESPDFRFAVPTIEKVVVNFQQLDLMIDFGSKALLHTHCNDLQLDVLNQPQLLVIDGAIGTIEIKHTIPNTETQHCFLRSLAEGGIGFQFDERTILDSHSAPQADGRRLLFYVNSLEVVLQEPFFQFCEQVSSQLFGQLSELRRFSTLAERLASMLKRLSSIETCLETKVAVEKLLVVRPIQKSQQNLQIEVQDLEFSSKEETRAGGLLPPRTHFNFDVGGVSMRSFPLSPPEEQEGILLLIPFQMAASGSFEGLMDDQISVKLSLAVKKIRTKLRIDDVFLLDAAAVELLSDLVVGKFPPLFLETSPLMDQDEPLRLPIEKLPNLTFQAFVEVEGFDARLIACIGNYNHPLVSLQLDQFQISIEKKNPPMAEIKLSHLNLGIQVFNGRLLCWEPLVERWPLAALLRLSTMEPSSLSITAEGGLSLNLSETMLEMLSFSLRKPAAVAERRAPEFISFRAKNLTGCKIILEGLYISECPLESAAEVSFAVKNSDWTSGTLIPQERLFLGAQIIHGERTFRIQQIPVDQEGEYLFCFPLDERETEPRIVCHISWKEGIHLIDFHDGFTIRNWSQQPIEMKSLKTTEPVTRSILEPNQGFPIPLLGRLHSTIQLRPLESAEGEESTFDWSVEAIDLNQLGDSLLVSCPMKNNERSKTFFQVHLRRAFPTLLNPDGRVEQALSMAPPPLSLYQSVTLLVTPTLSLQNLLPFEITFTVTEVGSGSGFMRTIRGGQTLELSQADIRKQLMLAVDIGDERMIKCHDALISDPLDPKKRGSVLALEAADGQILDLSLQFDPSYGDEDLNTQTITICSDFVIQNETAHRIFVRRHEAGHIFDDVAFDYVLEPQGSSRKQFMLLSKKLLRDQYQFHLRGSHWSEPVDLRSLGSNTALNLTAGEERYPFAQFGIHIETGREGLTRTRVISIQPRYSLINASSFPIQVMECTSLGATVPAHLKARRVSLSNVPEVYIDEKVVSPGEKIGLHFRSSDCSIRIQSLHPLPKKPEPSPSAGGTTGSEGTSAGEAQGGSLQIRTRSLKGRLPGPGKAQGSHLDEQQPSGWSPPFSVAKEESLCLRLWNGGAHVKPRYLMASVSLEEATNEILITDCKKLPFRIENKLESPVSFFQTPFGRDFVHAVNPNQDYPFGLDLPSHPDKTLEIEVEASLVLVNPAEIVNEITTLPLPPALKGLEISTFIEDGARVIRLCKERDEASLQHLTDERSKASIPSMASVPALFRVSFAAPGIAISLIDDRPKETLLVSLQRIKAGFNLDNYDFDLSLQVADLQVDDMQLGVSFPRILFSRLAPPNQPFLQVSSKISRVKDWDIENGLSFININQFSLSLREFDVEVDEESFCQLLTFGDSLSDFLGRVIPTLGELSFLRRQGEFDECNFEHFYVSGLRAFLTCHVHETFLERVGVVKRRPTLTSSITRGLRVVALSSLRNLRRVPLSLAPVGFENRKIPRESLLPLLARRFLRHAKSQLLSIFGPQNRPDFFSEFPDLPHPLPASWESQEEPEPLHSQRAEEEEEEDFNAFASVRRRWPRRMLRNGALVPYDPQEAFGFCVLAVLKEKYPKLANDDYQFHFFLDAESDSYFEKGIPPISKIAFITDLSILVARILSKSTSKKPELKKENLELDFELGLKSCTFVSEEGGHVLVEYLPPPSPGSQPIPLASSFPPLSLSSSSSSSSSPPLPGTPPPSPCSAEVVTIGPEPLPRSFRWQHHFSCSDPLVRAQAVKKIQDLLAELQSSPTVPPL